MVGLLDSLVLTTAPPHKVQGHYNKWLHKYKEALRFLELSYSNRSALIKSLAHEINKNFEIGGEGFLDERIALFKSFFDLTPAENASREDHLQDLLPTLYQRFEETSQHEDIDEILSFNTEILDLLSASHPHSAASILAATLASSCMARFKLTGQFYHIDEALSHLQGSIFNSHSSDPNRAGLFDIQGNWFHLRFKETGQSSYLDQADQSYRRAVGIRHVFEPNTIYPQSREAAVLCDRFKLTRRRSYLDEAISLHRHSLPLLSEHARERASASFEFADALLTLFNESGQAYDLDEAIEYYEEALKLNPAPRFPRSNCLNGLGNALRKRSEISGQHDSFSRVVSLHEEALELCPEPYIERDNCFSGLASVLASRYARSGHQSDHDKAIKFYRNALELLPPTHPSRANSLFGLATTLQSFYKMTNQGETLQEAMTYYREALQLLPLQHVDRADSLFGLAAALRSLYQHRRLKTPKNVFNGPNHQDSVDDAPPSYSTVPLLAIPSSLLPIAKYRTPGTRRSVIFNSVGLGSSPLQTPSNKAASPDKTKDTGSLHHGEAHTPNPPPVDQAATVSNTADDLPVAKHRQSGPQDVFVLRKFVTENFYAELDETISLLKETLPLRPYPHPARIESLKSLVDALETRWGNADYPQLSIYRKELTELESRKAAIDTATPSTVVSNLAQ